MLVEVSASSAEESITRLMRLDADLANGFEVFRLCADCHGSEGQGTFDGKVPVISGQHQGVLIKQLADFRDGRRLNEAMYPFSQDNAIGGNQAIVDVTAYIATLLMPAEPVIGPWPEVSQGRRLYLDHCSRCHGQNGEGNGFSMFPRIHGQHYPYLVRQMEDIKHGRRFDSDPVMKAMLDGLDSAAIKNIANFLSRQLAREDLVAPPGWQNPDFNYGIQ